MIGHLINCCWTFPQLLFSSSSAWDVWNYNPSQRAYSKSYSKRCAFYTPSSLIHRISEAQYEFSSVAQFFLIEIYVFWSFDLKLFALSRQRLVLGGVPNSFFNFASRKMWNAFLIRIWMSTKKFMFTKTSVTQPNQGVCRKTMVPWNPLTVGYHPV